MTPRGKYKGHDLYDLLPRVRWVSCNFTRVMISTNWQQLDLDERGLLTTLVLHQAANWTVPSGAVEIAHLINLREWTPERVEQLLPRVMKFFKPAGRKAMYHMDTRQALLTAMDQIIGSKNGGAKSGEVRGKQSELPLDNSGAPIRTKGGSNTYITRQTGHNKKLNTTKRAGAQGEKARSRVYEQTTLELTSADLLLLQNFPKATSSLYSAEVPKVIGKARIIAFDDEAWKKARIAELQGREVTRPQLQRLVYMNDAAMRKVRAA
jgi:hypothetical protein